MNKELIVYTFGCRMNTFESNCIRKIAKDIGMQKYIIINSCAITAESERQVRQKIRQLYK